MAPASKVRFCVARRPASVSSAQVMLHSKVEMGNSPLRPPSSRRRRCSTSTCRDSSQHWRASSRRSSQGASGNSARHWAAMSRLVISLLMWRCTVSRSARGSAPSYSCISASRCTTVKQASRAGGSRSVSPASWKWPIVFTPAGARQQLQRALARGQRVRGRRGQPQLAAQLVGVRALPAQVGQDALDDHQRRRVQHRVDLGHVAPRTGAARPAAGRRRARPGGPAVSSTASTSSSSAT